MADPVNIIMHLLGDADRQRHLARMQQLRDETAAHSMQKVAATIQGGAALNTLKGVMPFAMVNASRGLATVATTLAGATVYTGVPMQPAPARSAPRRRGRSRR